MSDLYRLVYASKNLLPGKEADASASVAQILETSQRNNAKAGVTGALMFNGGAFAQVLEGPRLGVETTFERIQRDERHGDVTGLQCGPVEERGFANWSMAFVGQSARGLAMWSRLAAESGFDVARMDGDAVFTTLHDLVMEEEGVGDANARSSQSVASPLVRRSADDATATVDGRSERVSTPPEPAHKRLAALPASSENKSSLPALDTKRQIAGKTTEAILAVIRKALTEERQRTTDLRNEVDDLRVALAAAHEQVEASRKERDLWAERAGLLASAMVREASEVMGAAAHNGETAANGRSRPFDGVASTVKSVA